MGGQQVSAAVPQVLLFDLGGVLVEWDGIEPLCRWAGLTREQARKFWLDSPSVRKFEAGFCTPDEFVAGAITELNLPRAPEEFLAQFLSWDRGPFPGAVEFLAELAPRYRLACLSNNNVLHWEKLHHYPGLLEKFEQAFASFKIHKVKPDPEIFEYVIPRLGVPPDAIAFFDDNIECVEAGRKFGLKAYHTKGVAEVRAVIEAKGIRP